MAELLAVEGLTAGYGEAVVLEDVALSLEEGDSLALLGRNGMGKTTLLVTLMGLTRMRGGTLRWRGRDLAAMPTHRRSRAGNRLGAAGALHVPVAHRRGAPDRGRAARVRGTSPGSTRSFRGSTSGARISATSSPAASSRCSRSAAR